MKNLAIAAAFVVGASFASFASTPIIFHDGIMETVLQDEYKEVAASELPQAVVNSFAKDFPDAKLIKAHTNEEGKYKLEIAVEGEAKTVYCSAEGEWLTEEDNEE
ncbi:hypothetical protein GCM10009117_11020 [Gangjinia marincola]|uniref:Beta-lactamase-inhibitor-like PepSY-like domain-containing protein n=1 Tax=Gangjinia marincola TaxID=578463 RepID=A0ABN1MGA7_9FLAO